MSEETWRCSSCEYINLNSLWACFKCKRANPRLCYAFWKGLKFKAETWEEVSRIEAHASTLWHMAEMMGPKSLESLELAWKSLIGMIKSGGEVSLAREGWINFQVCGIVGAAVLHRDKTWTLNS